MLLLVIYNFISIAWLADAVILFQTRDRVFQAMPECNHITEALALIIFSLRVIFSRVSFTGGCSRAIAATFNPPSRTLHTHLHVRSTYHCDLNPIRITTSCPDTLRPRSWIPHLDRIKSLQQTDSRVRCLGEGELLSDAIAWTAAKRQEIPRGFFALPAHGTEVFGVFTPEIFAFVQGEEMEDY